MVILSGFGALESFTKTFPLTLRLFAGCKGKGNDQVRVRCRHQLFSANRSLGIKISPIIILTIEVWIGLPYPRSRYKDYCTGKYPSSFLLVLGTFMWVQIKNDYTDFKDHVSGKTWIFSGVSKAVTICLTTPRRWASLSHPLGLSHIQCKNDDDEQSIIWPQHRDDNIAHCSYESGSLEDPSRPPPYGMWTRTDDPLTAPNQPQEVIVHFEKGVPVKVRSEGQEWTDSLDLFNFLNALGKKHGIGNRYHSLSFST